MDDYERYMDEDDIEKLIKDMKKDGYEEMMAIRENRSLTRVYALTSKKSTLYDVAIINKERYELSIIIIDGSMDIEDVAILVDEN